MRAFSLKPGGVAESSLACGGLERGCACRRPGSSACSHVTVFTGAGPGPAGKGSIDGARPEGADVPRRAVWESPRVVYGQAGARARRLFCNEIYNYNCKLTLSSGPESRSYGISINYRFNLIPMSTVCTIDHMINSRSRQGYESNNIAGRETP